MVRLFIPYRALSIRLYASFTINVVTASLIFVNRMNSTSSGRPHVKSSAKINNIQVYVCLKSMTLFIHVYFTDNVSK